MMILVHKNHRHLARLIVLIAVALWFFGPSLLAQTSKLPTALKNGKEIEVADEYFSREEWAKAMDYYKKLAKSQENIPFIFKNYNQCLDKLKLFSDQEKFLKKAVKKYPGTFSYSIELAKFYKNQKQATDEAETLEDLAKQVEANPIHTESAAKTAIAANYDEYAISLFERSRKKLKDNQLYRLELAALYKTKGNNNQMFSELVAYLTQGDNDIQVVQTLLSQYITSKKDYTALDRILIEKAQTDPLNPNWSQLLYWSALQQQDYEGAFQQAKALDLQFNAPASKCMELAALTAKSGQSDLAIRILEYVTAAYANKPVYFDAQIQLIQYREEKIKSTYPVAKTDIGSLISEYKNLNQKTVFPQQKLDAKRNMAILYGTYLHNTDTAIQLMEEIVKDPYATSDFKDRCKLDLGDFYLIKGEPWESTLIYSQVEKSQKEATLGHEAKLRNAKLSYFRHEFELAKEHLDVLKLATSREIANDAMDLSLLIDDNLNFDSNAAALKAYARIEQLLFLNQDNEALSSLDSMSAKFKNSPMEEEVLWLRAKIFKKQLRWANAAELYDKILKAAPDGLYADDALFQLAQLNEGPLAQKDKAMELYQNLIKNYPGSIFVVEARKKFRELRGDSLEKKL